MRVALVTPMKRLDHPVPSGDRTFGRLVVAALRLGGHAVTLPTTLSTRCDRPDDLPRIERTAAAEAARIAVGWRRDGPPDAVLTYHNYHRAPDLVGVALADAFGLPYALLEASRAPRHAAGEWAHGFGLADCALDRADAVGAVTPRDTPALAAHVGERVVVVPPFVDAAPFAGVMAPRPGALVCAAMMRPRRKADSLALLAEVFALVQARVPAATLSVAGDGPARAALEPRFPPGSFVGALAQDELAALFRRADVFVWPALNEPFGFVFLEAQAAGLPVVGGAAPGVAAVVADGGVLVPEGDVAAMAQAVVGLVSDRELRARTAAAASAFAAVNDLAAGAARLDDLLARAARHRRRS